MRQGQDLVRKTPFYYFRRIKLKTWQYIGTSIRTGNFKSTGKEKFRFSNSEVRHKILEKTYNEKISMFKLPYAMSKEDAIKWYSDNVVKGLTPMA